MEVIFFSWKTALEGTGVSQGRKRQDGNKNGKQEKKKYKLHCFHRSKRGLDSGRPGRMREGRSGAG